MKPQRVLAIETSSPRLSLAVGTETTVLEEYQGPLEWRHAESLFDGMKQLLAQARWPVKSLTGVLVSTGPGSFTGIRIGLAAARALGQALKVPVVGVSSLQTIACGLLREGRFVCPLINALRGEVFTALYAVGSKGQVKTLWKECRLPLRELTGRLKSFTREPLWLAGDAVPIYREELKRTGGRHWHFAAAANCYPRAGVLIKFGGNRLPKAQVASYQQVVPLYLRSAAAQERRKV